MLRIIFFSFGPVACNYYKEVKSEETEATTIKK